MEYLEILSKEKTILLILIRIEIEYGGGGGHGNFFCFKRIWQKK